MKPNQEGIIARLLEAYAVTDDESLAQRLDCGKSAISNYRGSRRKIPISIIMKTVAETHKSYDWLITGKGQETSSLFSLHVDLLRKIHDAKDETYVNAIDQNLAAFAKAVTAAKVAKEKAEKEVLTIKEDVRGIKDGLNALTDVVGTLSTEQQTPEEDSVAK